VCVDPLVAFFMWNVSNLNSHSYNSLLFYEDFLRTIVPLITCYSHWHKVTSVSKASEFATRVFPLLFSPSLLLKTPIAVREVFFFSSSFIYLPWFNGELPPWSDLINSLKSNNVRNSFEACCAVFGLAIVISELIWQK